MAKRSEAPPPPTPPTISRAEGKRRLEIMRERAKALIPSGRVSDEASQAWADTTLGYIQETFGSDTPHAYTFIGQQQMRVVGYGGGDNTSAYEVANARHMQRRIAVLDQLIEIIDMEAGFPSPAQTQQQFDFWLLLHPEIVQHSKPRFEAGQFADSVEAAFKHVNTKVKELVLRKTGKELDGAPLMQTAFSPNAPQISLGDLSTESGRNIQQGYMQIFAGSMTGIRNPKAHGNIQIDANRATHFLFLASLLLCKCDEQL